MTSKSEWEIVPHSIDPDSEERLFFTEHEWETVEAAASRIIPTDHDPGAREARVVVFIDRYLSGIDYMFASAAGEGFLQMSGKEAHIARARNVKLRRLYREGVKTLDEVAQNQGAPDFKSANEEVQDAVLVQLGGAPKPMPISLELNEEFFSRLQGNTDEGKPFFDTLCFHVRQGFYADPVYGGNRDRVGWKVVGFPGPDSLKDTMDGTYTTALYFEQQYDWEELIPGYKRPAE